MNTPFALFMILFLKEFCILTAWNERASHKEHVLTIFGGYCRDRMKYNHLTIEDFPYKKHWMFLLVIDVLNQPQNSDLIGTMSAFNCPYLCPYFSEQAEICQ